MKILNLFLLYFVLGTLILGAQEVDNQPEKHEKINHYNWQLGVSMFATDHTSVRGFGDGFFDFDDFSVVPFPAKLTVVRGLNRSFDLDGSVNLGQIDNKRLLVEDEFMVNATMGLRYRLANGYLLNPTSWFDPYLRLGAGVHHLDYQEMEFTNVTDQQGHYINNGAIAYSDHFTVTGGLGINFWIKEKFGLNVMSEYYHMPGMKSDNIDFFQHSAGLVFRFGQLDRDGDGILDKEDECPDTPGLAEFNGCPDADGDGLPDHKDACPVEFGPKENEGCPYRDKDQDGILDDEDECPEVPGLIELKGCPPVIVEYVEEVVEEVVEEEPEPVVVTKVFVFRFEFDSFKNSQSVIDMLKTTATDMRQNDKKYYVDGYADSSGPESYNMRLSERRAKAVADELIASGIDADRLIVRGMGESKPLCPANDTEECRKENRRVEVTISEIPEGEVKTILVE